MEVVVSFRLGLPSSAQKFIETQKAVEDCVAWLIPTSNHKCTEG